MARRLPNQNNAPLPPPSPDQAGGAAGVIPEAATTIVNPGEAATKAAQPEEAVEVKVQRYRVERTTPILYGGVRTQLAAGKVIDTVTYDVEYLKRQGVQLQELED